MKERILITGSNGFIGKQLKEGLSSQGYSISEFNTADGDISKTELNLKDIDHVFHLAGKSFVPDSWKEPKAFYDINVTGTLNVLEFCRKSGASLTLMRSYIYCIPQRQPIDENHPAKPANPYGHSKLLAEEICLFYQENFKVNTTVIRPFNIYGAKQDKHFLIPHIMSQLLDKFTSEIEVLDLAPKRDYLFLDDLIKAIIVLFQKKKTGIYNIGAGYSISVEEILNIIMEVAGIKKKVVSKNTIRKNEIPDVIADISKLKNDTGWSPQYTFEQGIAEVLKREHL